MPAKITATEQPLDTVFSKSYSFGIPRYQRPYSWRKEQVEDLLDDLMTAFGRDSEEPYFLGSVVLIEDENPRSQVVDGQQRLTTLTMLFCVLRDIATSLRTINELDGVVSEVANTIRGTDVEYRLVIRELDREFFQKNVQTKGGTTNLIKLDQASFSDVQKRMFENVQCLHDELLKHSEEFRKELSRYIIQNCYLVVVSATDRGSAHRIFSVMNDRGLDLSPTDILKADVLGTVPPEIEEAYANKWENIEVDLGRESFRDLFAHIRMIYQKSKQRRGTLQDEFQEAVLKGVTSQEFVDDVLEPYADVYADVSKAAYAGVKDAEAVNWLLRHLRRLDNFDWIPPVMSYFHLHKTDVDGILRFTQDLERLAYGLFIRRTNLNDRISRYGRLLAAIERGDNLFEAESPLQLTAAEKANILSLLDGDIYNQSRIPAPLLMRLDSVVVDPDERYEYRPSRATSIEHVLPQNPPANSEWLLKFPDAEERAYWTHRLANLVLLSRRKNSRASNWDFRQKKQEYFLRNGTTSFSLTTQVVGENEWTPAVLERRQKWLLDTLKKEWRLG